MDPTLVDGFLVQTTLGFLVLVGRNLLFLDSVSCRGLLLVQALICCTHDRYHLSVDLPPTGFGQLCSFYRCIMCNVNKNNDSMNLDEYLLCRCYNLLMDKEIYRHRDYVQSELNRIKHIANNDARLASYRELANYHALQTWNFQHERQIHLYVTIIFGVIMLAAWAVLFGWLVAVSGAYNIVTWLLIALVTILTILEGCYLGYYYRMENRTQILYPLDRKIYDAIQAMLK